MNTERTHGKVRGDDMNYGLDQKFFNLPAHLSKSVDVIFG